MAKQRATPKEPEYIICGECGERVKNTILAVGTHALFCAIRNIGKKEE